MVLRYLRKRRGETLRQEADKMQSDPAGLSRIERGAQMPRPDLAKKLAKYYGISLDLVYAGPELTQEPEAKRA